jgi:hypothetical protein
MRLVLAIIAFAQLMLGISFLPRPVIRFAGHLGGRLKDAPNTIAMHREGYIR